MHCSSGILFNHESPRRGFEFVTRKITHEAVRISLGLSSQLHSGNLEARRTGSCRDYVRAMWLMLQQDEPGDFVVATGQDIHSRVLPDSFLAHQLGLSDYVMVNPRFLRPADVDLLVGDARKATQTLGWQPTMSFTDMVREMVESDVETLKKCR